METELHLDSGILKINELSSHKRNGGNLNTFYKVKEANLKRLHNVFSIIWYSGKGKTIETVKFLVIERVTIEGRDVKDD